MDMDLVRVLTKISEVLFSHLRSLGHNSVVYVYDSYLQGDTNESYLNNFVDTFIERIRVCHPPRKPPILIPSQEIPFPGFAISSKKVTLTLTNEKKIKTDDSMPKQQYYVNKRTSKNYRKYCCNFSCCNLWASSL